MNLGHNSCVQLTDFNKCHITEMHLACSFNSIRSFAFVDVSILTEMVSYVTSRDKSYGDAGRMTCSDVDQFKGYPLNNGHASRDISCFELQRPQHSVHNIFVLRACSNVVLLFDIPLNISNR